MPVTAFRSQFTGENEGGLPRIARLITTDTLATTIAAGYLDALITARTVDLKNTDVVLVVASNGTQWYKPVFTAGSCQLTALP